MLTSRTEHSAQCRLLRYHTQRHHHCPCISLSLPFLFIWFFSSWTLSWHTCAHTDSFLPWQIYAVMPAGINIIQFALYCSNCFNSWDPRLTDSIPTFLLLTMYGALSNTKHLQKKCHPCQHSFGYFATTYQQGELVKHPRPDLPTSLPWLASSLPPSSTSPGGLHASIKWLGQVKCSPEWFLEGKKMQVLPFVNIT